MSTSSAGGPLDGVVVVDLSRALAGPHATMMLGDLGAQVIKVEAPGRGDDTRGWGPPFVAPDDEDQRGAEREVARDRGQPPEAGYHVSPTGASPAAESTYFLSANRNKASIILDLKEADDHQVLVDLVGRADVLVENFRTGVLERLGLGADRLLELNPRLVVLSITGFGHDGPEGGRPGYDQIAQGEAGLMSLTGSGPDDPQKFGTPICDLLAGMYGAYGVVSALYERARTGRGQVVRTSLLAAGVGVHAFQGTRWTIAGEVGRAGGNQHASIAPYGLFRCRDGAVQIAVGSESLWRRFCAGFGLNPDADGVTTNAERVVRRDEVIALVESAFADWAAADLLERLEVLGVPAGKVRSIDEVYGWEQARSQGLLVEVEHDTLGSMTLPGPPLRFFAAGGEEQTRTAHRAPPTLGADNQKVRDWLAEHALQR